MRTTDPDPKPLGPVLGEKVRPAPAPRPQPAPPATPGVHRDADGRLYTNLPLPKCDPWGNPRCS